MNIELINRIAALRVTVGFLGEKDQAGWWASSFFGSGSSAFLSPLFPRTEFLAQCNGAFTAASLKHDERIGVGQVYHLFRLPEDIEQGIHRILQSQEDIEQLKQNILSRESALAFLNREKLKSKQNDIGPTHVGAISKLRDLSIWALVGVKYAAGFESRSEIYPYFADRK